MRSRRPLPVHRRIPGLTSFAAAAGLLLGAAVAPCGAVDRVDVSIGEIVHGDARVRDASAKVAVGRALAVALRAQGASAMGTTLPPVAVHCESLLPQRSGGVSCDRATIDAGQTRAAGSLRYDPATGLDAKFAVGPAERWTLLLRSARGGYAGRLQAVAVDPARFGPWLPKAVPPPTKGRLSLAADVSPAEGATTLAHVEATLAGLAFSDKSGMHAGENIAATLTATAKAAQGRTDWQASLRWEKGGVFWQPVFFDGGRSTISMHAVTDARGVRVDSGELDLAGVGKIRFAGRAEFDRPAQGDASVRSADIDLAKAYGIFVKPFFPSGLLGSADAKGRASVDIDWRAGALARVALALKGAELVDAGGRLAIGPVEATVPWDARASTTGTVRIERAALYGLPIGTVKAAVASTGTEWRIDDMVVPIFDGALRGHDLRASLTPSGLRWAFQGEITPISLASLTGAMKWPQMPGTLSGQIPRVSFADNRVSAEGALVLKAFDGTVVLSDLSWLNPFGPAPTFDADIAMRELDLEMLTRTYSFGTMHGRLDADIQKLELAGWKPARFVADVRNSPGRYEKRISQQAVQNISSLGGAGAGAAIQRSMLRIFKDFGYSRFGLRCVLEGPVCRMSGIEDRPPGYVIVAGGGIPAITVMGYNRTVGWEELVSRLMRITHENAKPVIK